jgi:hypothetical protein
VSYSCQPNYPLDSLRTFGDGMNVEGGSVAHKYLNERQIWANVCPIMDHPFVNGVEFRHIKEKNIYSLKESSVEGYNEPQVNYAFVEIVHYYLTNGHCIVQKTPGETLNVVVQMHRNSSGPKHLTLLTQMLVACYPELRINEEGKSSFVYEHVVWQLPEINVRAIFYFSDDPKFLGEAQKYVAADIVVSLGLCGGLNPQYGSSTLLVPSSFIPFSVPKMSLSKTLQYSVQNHLLSALADIISRQSAYALRVINAQFISPNPSKSEQKARALVSSDFKQAVIIQSPDIINPSQMQANFQLV